MNKPPYIAGDILIVRAHWANNELVKCRVSRVMGAPIYSGEQWSIEVNPVSGDTSNRYITCNQVDSYLRKHYIQSDLHIRT